MSGYRTIYREKAKYDSSDGEMIPLWGASFSSNRRFFVASSSGIVLCYQLQEKSNNQQLMMDTETLTQSGALTDGKAGILGCTAVSVIENDHGEEVVVACMTLDGYVRLYHQQDLKEKLLKDDTIPTNISFKVENATGNNIALCPCQFERETLVAVGCIDGSVKIYHTGLIHGAKDGSAANSTLKDAGNLFDSMGQGNSCAMSIAWSPHGELLAVGRKDGIVDVFSSSAALDTSAAAFTRDAFHRVHRMVAHSSFVRAVAFSPDGALLLTGGDDGRVHAYDIRRRKVALVGSFVGHKSWILGISWSPNSSTFATCSADKTVKMWDVSTKQNLHTFDGHLDKVWGISFSPSGSRIVSCGDDGIIQVYSCDL
mmetsp:Transcript_28280/g.40496  ORF Transcript_28280/g.40496 Transcript_28280/m.40496 type:complete len:370 (-) Transcript_28280:711-1820(-)